jgi:NADH-quinone oxidoreductase subunit J
MLELFITLIILSTLCVVLSKNIIQSVLYLISIFLYSSILFIYLGADFIGLIILIVYIGAIAVLFLFVVMMLNVRLLEIYSTFLIYLPIAIILCISMALQFIYLFIKSFNFFYINNIIIYYDWTIYNNIRIIAIGELLFNHFFIFFIGATLLLFVAMIGAIILTLKDKDIINMNINRYNSHSITWKVKQINK